MLEWNECPAGVFPRDSGERWSEPVPNGRYSGKCLEKGRNGCHGRGGGEAKRRAREGREDMSG